MTLYDVYETDIKLEEDGVWVDLTKEISVKVAALGNKSHVKAIEKLQRPYRSQIRKGNLDSEIEEDIHIQAIAKTVLLDWKGVKDKEGKVIPYSFENAYALLTDPTIKGFKSDILFLAKESQTFKAEEKEESVKNSKKSSAGN